MQDNYWLIIWPIRAIHFHISEVQIRLARPFSRPMSANSPSMDSENHFRKLNLAARQFERELRAGKTPSVSAAAEQVDESIREDLLRELLHLQMEYDFDRAGAISLDWYLSSVSPEAASVVRSVYGELTKRVPDESEIASSASAATEQTHRAASDETAHDSQRLPNCLGKKAISAIKAENGGKAIIVMAASRTA